MQCYSLYHTDEGYHSPLWNTDGFLSDYKKKMKRWAISSCYFNQGYTVVSACTFILYIKSIQALFVHSKHCLHLAACWSLYTRTLLRKICLYCRSLWGLGTCQCIMGGSMNCAKKSVNKELYLYEVVTCYRSRCSIQCFSFTCVAFREQESGTASKYQNIGRSFPPGFALTGQVRNLLPCQGNAFLLLRLWLFL